MRDRERESERQREREQRVKQSVTSQSRSTRHNLTRTTMKLLLLVSFLSLWRRSDGTGAAPIKVLVKEGDDVTLPCSFSSNNIRQELFDWKKDKDKKNMKEVFMYDKGKVYDKGDSRQDEQFRGRVFHFPEHLGVGNASIVIRATKLTDSGSYTCLFPLLVPERRSNIELVVDPILKDRSDENIPGAAPRPSVKSLEETKDWSVLRCEVLGAFPKPDVQWQNRAGDIVPAEEPQVTERGGRYDVILQTTVTKTDIYRCVSTQEEIHHQIYDETHVYIGGAASKPSVTILDGTTDWSLLSCEVLGASPKPDVQWQNRAGDKVPAKDRNITKRGDRYDIILQTTVTKTDHYRCVSTQEEIHHQTEAEIFVLMNDNHTLLIGVGVGAILTLLVVGFVGVVFYFVYKKKTHSAEPSNPDQAANGILLSSQDQIDKDSSLP